MRFCPNLVLLGLLLLGGSDGEICPAPCHCSMTPPSKLIIDCSRRELHKLPQLPGATEELDLQQNQLTSIPPGAFDHLLALRKLNLSHNPLHCDCRLRYLHMWLDIEGLNSDAVCLTPPNLSGKPLALVAPTLLAPCTGTLNLCSQFLVTDSFLFLFLFLLLFLMVLSLRTFQGMKFKIKVNENDVKVQNNWTPVIGSLKRRFHFSVNSC